MSRNLQSHWKVGNSKKESNDIWRSYFYFGLMRSDPVAIDLMTPLLYVYAGSPIVTRLTFDVQSRDLTCTFTGRHTTNVTWRRDGVVVTLNDTHQQTKRVVNSSNGTFQALLTINSSVGWSSIVGTYNCTVENASGQSSETVVVPGETCTSYCSVFLPLMHISTCRCISCCRHLQVTGPWAENGKLL